MPGASVARAARMYSPTLGRFMQTDPIGYGDGINWYDYVDGDPVNRVDPDGRYQRGNGFTDSEWKKFNSAQQSQARSMNRRANKLSAKAAKMNAKSAGSGAKKEIAAANLKAGASKLSNTGASAPTANLFSASEYAALGRQPGSAAHTNVAGQYSNFKRGENGLWGNGALGAGWIIGHEGLHTAGLSDYRPISGGPTAYLGSGKSDDLKLLNGIKGTIHATTNPDSLLRGDN